MKLISNYELVKNVDENNLIKDLEKIDLNSIYDNEIRVMALSTIQSFNILKEKIIEERQNIEAQIMKYQDKEPA